MKSKTYEKGLKIKCPKCGKTLIDTYKDRTDTIKIACRNCNKWIWYNPKNKKYEVKKIPQRTQASGMRFY